MKRYTLCVDFDGVLHDYHGDWKGASVIEGEPVNGAFDWLRSIADDFDVVILTTRGNTIIGQEACKRWLERHGLEEEIVADIVVTDEKPPALIYIDDRAWRFEGAFPTVHEINTAIPWNRQRKQDAGEFLTAAVKVRGDLEPAMFAVHVDEQLEHVRRSLVATHAVRREQS